MCTVTIVPDDDGFRLACNRDERRDRAAATPPNVHRLEHRIAVFPLDPVGGGTWVGVNDARLVAVLLNRTMDSAGPTSYRALRSRGLIIPSLLDCGSVPDALEMAARLNPAQFNPFRLVVVQRMVAGVLTSDGFALSVETMDISRPLMLTSSSLGDDLVEAPRRRLFERLVLKNECAWVAAQTRFHAHQWRSRADISVTMKRQAARTVSRTCITVTSHTSELCYDPIG
jgi:Transport and Golgi organisation 2